MVFWFPPIFPSSLLRCLPPAALLMDERCDLVTLVSTRKRNYPFISTRGDSTQKIRKTQEFQHSPRTSLLTSVLLPFHLSISLMTFWMLCNLTPSPIISNHLLSSLRGPPNKGKRRFFKFKIKNVRLHSFISRGSLGRRSSHNYASSPKHMTKYNRNSPIL